MPRVSPLLGMPVLVMVLYGVVYATGAWTFGQAHGYVPVGPLTQAVLFVVCIAWYGRAGLGRSLLGGAVLLAFTTALALAIGAVSAAVFRNVGLTARAGPALLIGLINSMLIIAIIMAISARVCPALRQAHFWIIALVAYPIFSLFLNSALPLLLAMQSPTRDRVTTAVFVTFVVRQLAVFTCLGTWVARPPRARDVSDIFS